MTRINWRHSLIGIVIFGLNAGTLGAREPIFVPQTIDQIDIGYGLAVGRVDADDAVDVLLADQHEIVWYQNPSESTKDGPNASPDKPKWGRHVMAEQLTPRDHVCIAARDVTGDGLVEVAVGANWNPSETIDRTQSGGVYFLDRPPVPQQTWLPRAVTPFDPTTHRMVWFSTEQGVRLAVLPLHGVGNRDGAGETIKVALYDLSAKKGTEPAVSFVDTGMHMTHNFDLVTTPDGKESLLVGGREGVVRVFANLKTDKIASAVDTPGVGEVRSYSSAGQEMFATIEPMHGTDVVLHEARSGTWTRTVLDRELGEGHGLACADLLGTGKAQVIAGWRKADLQGKTGIKLYAWENDTWKSSRIDDNSMVCEDLKVADLNGDGKLDIVAAGRATRNLVIYWQQ